MRNKTNTINIGGLKRSFRPLKTFSNPNLNFDNQDEEINDFGIFKSLNKYDKSNELKKLENIVEDQANEIKKLLKENKGLKEKLEKSNKFKKQICFLLGYKNLEENIDKITYDEIIEKLIDKLNDYDQKIERIQDLENQIKSFENVGKYLSDDKLHTHFDNLEEMSDEEKDLLFNNMIYLASIDGLDQEEIDSIYKSGEKYKYEKSKINEKIKISFKNMVFIDPESPDDKRDLMYKLISLALEDRNLSQKEYDFLMDKLEEYSKYYDTKQQMDIVKVIKKISQLYNDIKDSIQYAKRIQDVLLPKQEKIDNYFKENFVLNMPKDNVSGDFYFLEEKNGKIMVSVSDCTGHGVPGAFLSVLLITHLNSILEKGIINPNVILGDTRSKLKESFSKSKIKNETELNIKENKVEKLYKKITNNTDQINDGMDSTFCSIEKENQILKFAGGYNDLIYYTKKPIEEIPGIKYSVGDEQSGYIYRFKADKMPIGRSHKEDQPFNMITHKYTKGDKIFMHTDGFPDQFGGESNKKLKMKPFLNKILEIQDKPLKEQNQILKDLFNNWKGKNEQIDDVCVMGLELN